MAFKTATVPPSVSVGGQRVKGPPFTSSLHCAFPSYLGLLSVPCLIPPPHQLPCSSARRKSQ